MRNKSVRSGRTLLSKILLMENNKTADFYKKLKAQIDDTTKIWPHKYLFKFIVLSDKNKITQLEAYFNHMGAVISKKLSKNGKYTSVSVLVIMNSSDAIIDKYKEVSQVEGIISL